MSPLLFLQGGRLFFAIFCTIVRYISYFCSVKQNILDMNRRFLILFVNLLFCCVSLSAQDAEKSELQKRAESIDPKTNIASARSTFIHAFNDYANQGKIHQAVECAAKATADLQNAQRELGAVLLPLKENADTMSYWTTLDQAYPREFHFNNTVDCECIGWHVAVKLMKYSDAQCEIIVPSKLGFTEDQTSVTPYVYILKIKIKQ